MLRTHEIRTFVSHASLSLSERRQAEAAFSEERNCVIVATSTLELGIDVGDLDRVIQIDSPSSVSSFLQRMGRTGRRTGGRRNCLFLTTNDNAFLLALGVTQKWSEAWVEAAVPPAEPWHIVAQQAMVLTLERGELATRELVQLLQGSFPELQIADIEVLVEHMVGQQFLDRAEGVVRVGPQTERSYARGPLPRSAGVLQRLPAADRPARRRRSRLHRPDRLDRRARRATAVAGWQKLARHRRRLVEADRVAGARSRRRQSALDGWRT